jgi:Flp pilus assembly protein TadD
MDKNTFIAEAETLYKLGDFVQLETFSDGFIQVEEVRFSAYFFKGLAQTKINKLESAIQNFDKALEIEPENANVISERGVTYHLLGKNKLALLDLDKALALEPTNPYRYSSRAFLREILKDLKGAVEDYETAISLDPEDAVAHNNLGMLKEKMGYIKDSKVLFSKADELLGIDIQTQSKEKKATQEVKIESLKQDFYYKTDIIKKVITDKKMRKEFFRYLKSIFVKKKT